MRLRSFPAVVIVVVMLSAGAIAPIASAHGGHHPAPYKATHPTKATPVTGWVGSYIGSSSWSVSDQRSIPDPSISSTDRASYDESSNIKFNYQ
jgi:hypothetical protein